MVDEFSDEMIEKRIRKAGDERLFYIAEALKRGVTVETIHEWSQIDLFFLYKMQGIIKFEKELANIHLIMNGLKKQRKKAFQI